MYCICSPVWFIHCCVCQVDEHQHSLSAEHALFKLSPVARLLCLEHPQTDVFGQLGKFLGVWHSGDLCLTLGAMAMQIRVGYYTVTSDL